MDEECDCRHASVGRKRIIFPGEKNATPPKKIVDDDESMTRRGTHTHKSKAKRLFFLDLDDDDDDAPQPHWMTMGDDDDDATTTTTTTTTTAFVDYAPYYTRQPREETWRKQRELWGRTLVRCVGLFDWLTRSTTTTKVTTKEGD